MIYLILGILIGAVAFPYYYQRKLIKERDELIAELIDKLKDRALRGED